MRYSDLMKRFYLVLATIVLSSFGQGLWAQNEDGLEVVQAVVAEAASENEVEGFGSLSNEIRAKLSSAFQDDLGGNSWGSLLFSFGIILLTYVARKIVGYLFENWLHRIAAKTSWEFDDKMIPAMRGPVGWMVFVLGMFIALAVLNLPPEWDRALVLGFKAATMTVVFWGLLRAVDVFSETMTGLAKNRDSSVHGFIPLIQKAARTFLIIVAVILVVQNLGYSVSSLLAGLGIGGLAVALAAQETLGNFFGSVSLVADRPFKVGDWIQVGGKVDGDVEEIGMRSTKVRTWSKSVMSIPNKVLANEIIENWSKMPKRRVKQYIGVTYSTPADSMHDLVEDIKQLLKEDEGVQQDFILVNFTDFGESSLQILVYYFTSTTAWLAHMDIRQRINIKIMKAVEARGSSMAFPTRSLQFEGELAERIADGISSKS
jgi:MscS family membrane protein